MCFNFIYTIASKNVEMFLRVNVLYTFYIQTYTPQVEILYNFI